MTAGKRKFAAEMHFKINLAAFYVATTMDLDADWTSGTPMGGGKCSHARDSRAPQRRARIDSAWRIGRIAFVNELRGF